MSESPLLLPDDLENFRSGDTDLNLGAAVAAIRGMCGWHIAPVRTETLTLECSNGVVILPTLRATGVVVTVNGATIDASTYTLSNTHLRFVSGWRCARSCYPVTVSLTHGYDQLPDDLKRAALSIADDGSLVGGRLRTAGPFTYEAADEADSPAAAIARYTLPPRP